MCSFVESAHNIELVVFGLWLGAGVEQGGGGRGFSIKPLSVIIWFKVHDKVNNCSKFCKNLVCDVWTLQALSEDVYPPS